MKNLGNLTNWTKNDLARVIVQAMFNADQPSKADNIHVKRMMKHNKATLVLRADAAINIINRAKMQA